MSTENILTDEIVEKALVSWYEDREWASFPVHADCANETRADMRAALLAVLPDISEVLKAAERDRLSAEIIAEMDTVSAKDAGVRVGYALAANLVKRGRRLTSVEKLRNLHNAIFEDGNA